MKFNRLGKSYRFPLLLTGSILVGCLAGLLLGKKALLLKPLGDLFLNAMFVLVVPLVFFTVAASVAGMVSPGRLRRVMAAMMTVFLLTGILAALVMIGAVRLFPPVHGAEPVLFPVQTPQQVDTATRFVQSVTVDDFPQLLSKNHMLPLILFSILFGVVLLRRGEQTTAIINAVSTLADTMIAMVELLMYYAPIGLGAYFAALIGDFGPKLLGSYMKTVGLFYLVALVYFFFAFSAYSWLAGGKAGFRRFWRHIPATALTALATSSSTATLPVNLTAAERIGIPADIRRMVLPIGATIHMEGSCLSGVLKIAFLFSVFDIPFTGLSIWMTAVAVSVLGGIALSGVPGGGLVGEMLIVSFFGFPPESFPIIATLGFLVDPASTMLNACGDSCSAMLVARWLEGRDWLES